MVAAEIMGAAEGLGSLLADEQQLGKTDRILAAIMIVALPGRAWTASSWPRATRSCAGRPTGRARMSSRADRLASTRRLATG